MSLIKNIITVVFLLLIVITVPYLIYEWSEHENLGSNEMGYVTKDTYNHYGSEQTIVLITGIHPREKLAINPEIESAKRFALTHNAKLVNYNVTVTKDPEDYKNSRYNGEHLVSEIVLPDIYKSKADVVIISHSHIEGYGEGFYLATPAMDEASVKLAENIERSGIDFKYFRTPENVTSYESTSIELVSKPLADSGYSTLVYEIPENITEQDSTDKTYDLLVKTYELLNQ
ncbi:MAG: hypothetical protein E7Z85_02195 [Methanosphaera stadtmanae]|nr:hypothetical protein [Methanosphaera stadtmanae]